MNIFYNYQISSVCDALFQLDSGSATCAIGDVQCIQKEFLAYMQSSAYIYYWLMFDSESRKGFYDLCAQIQGFNVT